jgi:hypothetical protein
MKEQADDFNENVPGTEEEGEERQSRERDVGRRTGNYTVLPSPDDHAVRRGRADAQTVHSRPLRSRIVFEPSVRAVDPYGYPSKSSSRTIVNFVPSGMHPHVSPDVNRDSLSV